MWARVLKVRPGVRTAARLITHQIPLLGEQGVAHVDFDIVDIPVPSLLTAETLLIEDILHLWGRREKPKKYPVMVGLKLAEIPQDFVGVFFLNKVQVHSECLGGGVGWTQLCSALPRRQHGGNL